MPEKYFTPESLFSVQETSFSKLALRRRASAWLKLHLPRPLDAGHGGLDREPYASRWHVCVPAEHYEHGIVGPKAERHDSAIVCDTVRCGFHFASIGMPQFWSLACDAKSSVNCLGSVVTVIHPIDLAVRNAAVHEEQVCVGLCFT